MARIIATSGPNRGTEYPLSGSVVLGRHEGCGITVPDRRASRKHAQVDEAGGKFFLRDLGSRNGTYINDKPISRQAMQDGDEITICDTHFVYREDAPRPKAVAPAGAKVAPAGAFGPAKSMVTFVRDQDADQANVNAVLDAEVPADTTTMAPPVGPGGADALQTSQRSLRTIYSVANALSTIHELQELLEEVMRQLFQIFPQADRGFVMLKEEGTEELQAQVIRSRKEKPGEAVEIKMSSTVVNEIMTKRKAVLTSDTASDEKYSDRVSIVNLQIRSMVSAPLIVRGDILGLIHIDTMSRSQAFTQADLELLAAVTPQVAIAIRNAQLLKQVELEAEQRSGLQRYFSPDLAEAIMKKEIDLEVGGRSCTGTAFFSDIIGFTRMSEKMKPADVVDRLNRYLHVMEEIIFRHGGTVDKFGGDSIMAFWNVLVAREGAVLAAVSAAMEMQNALFSFNYTVGGELLKSPLGMGIGLNTGEMVSGNMGSDQKIEFTVIGDAVNTAQRIESKAGRGQVFVSEATFKQIKKQVSGVKLPPVEVKNKSGLVQMYSVRCTKPEGSAEGYLTNLQVSITGGGAKADDGIVVWAIPNKKLTVVDLCCATAPAQGSEVSLQFELAEKPGLPTITGRVTAARKVKGPGSAMVEIPNCPKEILQIISPGNVVKTTVTAEQVVRV